MLKTLFNFCHNLGSRIKQWAKPTTATLVTASLADMTRSKADLLKLPNKCDTKSLCAVEKRHKRKP